MILRSYDGLSQPARPKKLSTFSGFWKLKHLLLLIFLLGLAPCFVTIILLQQEQTFLFLTKFSLFPTFQVDTLIHVLVLLNSQHLVNLLIVKPLRHNLPLSLTNKVCRATWFTRNCCVVHTSYSLFLPCFFLLCSFVIN